MTKREVLISTISDLSKEVTDVRYRTDWSALSDKELDSLYKYWEHQAEMAFAKDEQTIAKMLAFGAKDRATAIRWSEECDN